MEKNPGLAKESKKDYLWALSIPSGDTVPEQSPVAIIGGGLAGCECALALARSGHPVTLFEMKPVRFSPAHTDARLAELVCSNSLRSDEPAAGVGLLKRELRALGSAVMAAADQTRVPAGKALAVDRESFAASITGAVEAEPLIRLVRREIADLEDPALAGAAAVVVAAGPLATESLAADLARITGAEHLYFYDAIAPIVSADSIDMERVFWGTRYRDDEEDYLNCPMDRAEYVAFHQALIQAERMPAREFEKEIHFEGCMPVEVLASRGEMTLAFGPLKPVGLVDPRTGRRPFAVLQLRAERTDRSSFNLVGCQTRLTYPEQERVFRMAPGLAQAQFLRLGSMHRNTFVNAPAALTPELEMKNRPGVYLAGQITGVEGYVESAACGLWLGLSLAARMNGRILPPPPPETALGALLGHLQSDAKRFQPSNVHFGLMPAPEERIRKRDRKAAYAERAMAQFQHWLDNIFRTAL